MAFNREKQSFSIFHFVFLSCDLVDCIDSQGRNTIHEITQKKKRKISE